MGVWSICVCLLAAHLVLLSLVCALFSFFQCCIARLGQNKTYTVRDANSDLRRPALSLSSCCSTNLAESKDCDVCIMPVT